MTSNQLQTIESELKKRGYKKITQNLTSSESWAWFKSIKDDDSNGYQMAFRVWDWHSNKYVNENHHYGLDFWTSALGSGSRIDLTSNWEPICDIDTFEKMARDFNELVKRYVSDKSS